MGLNRRDDGEFSFSLAIAHSHPCGRMNKLRIAKMDGEASV